MGEEMKKDICTVIVAVLATMLGSLVLLLFGCESVDAESLPPYLERFTNEYGYTVVRVTDPGEPILNLGGTWPDVARHHYNTDQAWSADHGLLKIDKGVSGAVYLDGRNYQPLYHRDPPSHNRWHPTQPDTEVWADGDSVGTYNPRTDTVEVLQRFDGYSALDIGPSKGYLSNDGRMVALVALNPSGEQVAFAYDLQSATKYADIPLPNPFGSATISPLGDLLIAHGGWTTSAHDDQTQVYGLDGSLIQFWEEKHRPGHADVIADSQGRQWLVGRSKDDPDKYALIKRDLETGEVFVLEGNGPGHTSARNISGDEVVYGTYSDDTSADYVDLIVRHGLDGSAEVLAKANRYDSGYESEGHASASPDGSRVVFASNWGDGSNAIAAFVVEGLIPEPESIVLVVVAFFCVMLFITRRKPKKRGV